MGAGLHVSVTDRKTARGGDDMTRRTRNAGALRRHALVIRSTVPWDTLMIGK